MSRPEISKDEVASRTSLVGLIGGDITLKPKGREYWACCPFHSEKTASFSVNEDKGFYHCFGCGAHGDVFAWMMARYSMSFAEAVDDLAERAGLIGGTARVRGPRRPPPAPKIDRQSRVEALAEKQNKIYWARKIWAESRAASGTLVEKYLAGRGISAAGMTSGLPPTLRFHPSLHHSGSGLTLPAMVAAVQSACGKISGIHRTFLSPDGSDKAAVVSAKKMAGGVWGGAIRLAPAESSLCLAEGIETALSVMIAGQRGGDMPAVWAAGSLGNMAAVELPPIVRDLVLCVDADGDQTAMERSLDKAFVFHGARGCKVRVARPPDGMDFNDLLRAAG